MKSIVQEELGGGGDNLRPPLVDQTRRDHLCRYKLRTSSCHVRTSSFDRPSLCSVRRPSRSEHRCPVAVRHQAPLQPGSRPAGSEHTSLHRYAAAVHRRRRLTKWAFTASPWQGFRRLSRGWQLDNRACRANRRSAVHRRKQPPWPRFLSPSRAISCSHGSASVRAPGRAG